MKLAARFVITGDGSPVEDGAIEIRDGRIAGVGKRREIGAAPDVDYGDAVILPGLVNAHTHLELSFLAGAVPPDGDFVDWLRRMIHALSVAPAGEHEVRAAVALGINQSLGFGVTCVGDITRWPGWTRPVLAESALRGVSFGEVIAFGRRREQLTGRLEAAASPACQTQRVRCGISPHSPYSLEPEALSRCAQRASEINASLCIHLAESPEEEQFTQSAAGRLAEIPRELGIWDAQVRAAGARSVELCRSCGLLGPRTVLAHANYVNDDDLGLIAASGASVAYCPRTHAAFGHPPHRFRDMLRAGINVCVGTDSLASNPSLSVLDELRFLRERYPDFDALELIRMGTARGAVALGLAEAVGAIAPGKAADLAVLALDGGANRWEAILESTAHPIAVYIDGLQTSFRG